MKKFHYIAYLMLLCTSFSACKKEDNNSGKKPVVQDDIASFVINTRSGNGNNSQNAFPGCCPGSWLTKTSGGRISTSFPEITPLYTFSRSGIQIPAASK